MMDLGLLDADSIICSIQKTTQIETYLPHIPEVRHRTNVFILLQTTAS